MSKKLDPDTLAKSGSVDGLAWAETFVQHFYGREVTHMIGGFDHDEVADVSDIHGWFANAIENGKNDVRNNPERYGLAPAPAPTAGQERGPNAR